MTRFGTRAWVNLFLGASLCLATSMPASAAQPSAAPPSLDDLLRPAGISAVGLSPSGRRVAVLIKGRSSDSDLMVLEQRGGRTVTLLTTHLGPTQAVARYQWLSDDFLAIYYASPEADFAQFSVADVATHSIDVQDRFTRIIQSPWGDADHVLLSETGPANCRTRTVARCLVSYDLPGRTSEVISAPFTLLPVQFFAPSPAEIFATGRDRRGQEHEFRLDTSNGDWKEVPGGTVEQRRAQLQPPAAASADLTQQRARAGMPDAAGLWTEPDHHLVGLIGHAPQKPFLAVDSRLDGLEALLEQQYAGDRVQITGLNQTLTSGMVEIFGPDQPPLYTFFNDSGGLTQYAQLKPDLERSALGRTHIEHGWADGMPVAITLPPQGTASVGVLVEPFIGSPEDAEDPLESYDGVRQAFAQAGITVVRALVPLPASFPSTAAGGEWRAAEAARFQQVLTHVRTDLARGGPVCLYGRGPAGVLALAWSGLANANCAAAVGARLDPGAYTRTIQLVEPARRQRVRISRHSVSAMPGEPGAVTMAPSDALLHQELPALYGLPNSDQLANPAQWVPQLPSRVMLGYDMQLRLQQEYAAESGAFRGALRRAGKQLTYVADDAVQQDDIQSRERLLGAVVDYLRASMTAGTTAPVASAH